MLGERRPADPRQRLPGGEARGLVVRGEDGVEAQHAVVRHAADAAADGDGG